MRHLCILTFFLMVSCSKSDSTTSVPAGPTPASFPGTYSGTLTQTIISTGKISSIPVTTVIAKTGDPAIFLFNNDLGYQFQVQLKGINATNAYDFVGFNGTDQFTKSLVGEIANTRFDYKTTTALGNGVAVSLLITGNK